MYSAMEMVILKNIKRRQDMDLVMVIVVDMPQSRDGGLTQAVQVDSALFNQWSGWPCPRTS